MAIIYRHGWTINGQCQVQGARDTEGSGCGIEGVTAVCMSGMGENNHYCCHIGWSFSLIVQTIGLSMFPYVCMDLLTFHILCPVLFQSYFSSVASVHLHRDISTLLPLLANLWPCFLYSSHRLFLLGLPYMHSWLIGAPTSSIPTIFMWDALPATTFPIYHGLGQAPSMLACITSGLLLLWTQHKYHCIFQKKNNHSKLMCCRIRKHAI